MDSHLELFLRAFDRPDADADADACAALFADGGRLRYVDGRVDEGVAAVRERLCQYFADLSSTTHTLREHWHEDRVWIGEVEASYVLADHSILGPVSAVTIATTGSFLGSGGVVTARRVSVDAAVDDQRGPVGMMHIRSPRS
jgi:hypothetical protein